MQVNLPTKLKAQHSEIKSQFSQVRDTWREYTDEIIPQNQKLAERILVLIIGVIDYVIDNYSKIDITEYQEFLGYYDYDFYYGPHGDDSNYLDFDENLDGEPVTEIGWKFREEKTMTIEDFRQIREKYQAVLSLVSNQSFTD